MNVEPVSINSARAPSPEEARPRRRIVEFESAIERQAASFTQLSTSIFFSLEKFCVDQDDRLVWEGYIERLSRAFETAHGNITHSYYCKNMIAAAVLTDRQELCVIHAIDDSKVASIADLLLECDRLNVAIDRILAGADRSSDLKTSKLLLYTVVTKLLSLLDSSARPSPPTILTLHRREVEHVRDYFSRAARRHAQFDYFRGMLRSAGAIAALSAIGTSIWIKFALDLNVIIRILFGCMIAGGIGAIVSVMSRMSFGGLSLDYEADRRLLTTLGAFRPVIGLALGAAMWALAESGILALRPRENSNEAIFYVLIAFLAGFSERWAQDMLGRAADQIGGRSVKKRSQ